MAITLGTITTRAHKAGTTETINSIDCNIGSDRVLYVIIAMANTGNSNASVTFNTSENLTCISRRTGGTSGTSHALEIWRLVAPTATTASVVLTQSLATICEIGIIPMAGVDQGTPNDAVGGNGATSTDVEITAGTTYGGGDDLLLLATAWRDTNASLTEDAGVTPRINAKSAAASISHVGLGVVTDTNSASPHEIGVLSSSVGHSESYFNINAAGAASTAIPVFMNQYRQRWG